MLIQVIYLSLKNFLLFVDVENRTIDFDSVHLENLSSGHTIGTLYTSPLYKNQS